MTKAAYIQLLPLPPHFSHQHDNVKKIVREYAIANMTELVDDREDLLARLDASIDHGTKLGAAQQRCIDEILEQKAEIEALREDAERLEWLSQLDVGICHLGYGDYQWYGYANPKPEHGMLGLRAVIDQARGKGGGPNESMDH